MNEHVQRPEKHKRLQSMSLKISEGVERSFDTDDDAQCVIGVINCIYKNQEPKIHQGQSWTMDPIEKTISSIIFVEPNNDIEDTFGTRVGFQGCYDNGGRRRTLSNEDDAIPCIWFVIYQGTLCLDDELPINHPLRQFPHLGRGWDFERNCLIR